MAQEVYETSLDKVSNRGEDKISNLEIILLTFIVLGLVSFLGYFIYDSSVLIGNCRNNVPTEHCNNAPGDFALEPDTRSTHIEEGCGVDEKSPCVFTNIPTISEAVKKCNSLGNKCNRFIHNNKTMSVVSLTGNTIDSPGNHMFVRQNGITFQGQGNSSNSYNNVYVQGENTSNTSTSNNIGITSLFSNPFSSNYSSSSTVTSSSGSGGGGY
tara:strand:+ start:8392 stop:9027 length:636 start_codon:yes stop_codon:yes gene_type:complete